MRPAAMRSASAIATVIASRRKSFATNARSMSEARSSAADGVPAAREYPRRATEPRAR